MTFAGDQHVVGLEIAVDDPDRVRRGERAEHLGRELDQAAQRHRALTDRGGERHAFDEFHHDVRATIRQRRHVEHVHDVLVMDEIDRLRFGEESVEQHRIARALIGQDLDRDARADRRMGREIDASHPTFAEQRRQAIPTDVGPEQRVVDERALHLTRA